MGPPPWSLAAEAHDCFMVRLFRGSNRIQGCGAMLSAQGRGPLGSFSSRLTHPPSVGMSRRGQPIDFGPWTRRTRPGHGRRVLESHRWPIFMTERIMEEVCHGAALSAVWG